MKRLLHGPTIWMQAVKAIIPFSGLHCITPYPVPREGAA